MGLVKYSLLYGGVILGFALCFIFSLLSFIFIKGLLTDIAADPSNMLNLISYTYIAGIVCGTIIYRLLWTSNENKFIRLTDPLH
jgi:hypothetical protein